MSSLRTIARPYAQAVFEFSNENNMIEKWKEMLLLMSEIASFQQIKCFLSGALSPHILSSVFISVGREKFDQYAKNFIKLLSLNQRLNIIDNILEYFLELNLAHENVVLVELTSAFFLEKNQLKHLNNSLQKHIAKKIHFTTKIDRSIIGGVIIKLHDTVFDLSVRNHLKQLSSVLKS